MKGFKNKKYCRNMSASISIVSVVKQNNANLNRINKNDAKKEELA